MKYNIVRMDKADEQLRNIIFYIADDSGSVDIALNYLDKIETAMKRLEDFPNSGSVPRYAVLRKQGYRALIVERHLVFYKPENEKHVVTIYAMLWNLHLVIRHLH